MDKREYDRIWYSKNKDRIREIKNSNSKKQRENKRKYIIGVLKKSHCIDCGNKDWRVLEFDHRERSEKSFNIADSVTRSTKAIQLEIEKCDIVCANCHNIRTIEQRGYYKFI